MTTNTLTASTTGIATAGGNDGTLTIQTGPAGSPVNAITINASGNIALPNQPVTASVANTVTNKVAVVINGTTYYLLASTSGA